MFDHDAGSCISGEACYYMFGRVFQYLQCMDYRHHAKDFQNSTPIVAYPVLAPASHDGLLMQDDGSVLRAALHRTAQVRLL